MTSSRRLAARLVVDAVCLLLVFLPWIVLHSGVEPYKRGFFCDDESLKHPYHKSTINSTLLIVGGVGIPLLIIIVTEIIHSRHGNQHSYSSEPMKLGRCVIPPVVLDSYNLVVCFLFGAAAEQTITNILKYSVGRLRPHFFHMCQPDMSGVKCVDGHGLPLYVTAYACLGTNTYRLKEMRLSFPSGHASLSTYSMMFAVIYLQARMTWRGSRLLRPLLQTGLVWVAVGVCVSRVSDYKHHWSDVLAGFVIGLVIAILTGLYAAKLCRKDKRQVRLKMDEVLNKLEQQKSCRDANHPEQQYV